MGLTSSRPAVPSHASAADLAAHFSLSSHWSSFEPPAAVAAPFSASNRSRTADYLQHGWRAHTIAAKASTWARDPFDRGNSQAVLEVDYPLNSRSGEQFQMDAPARRDRAQTALLKYEVAFEPAFDFVKGGKLPGLYGSAPHAPATCAGGKHRDTCFSARLMWRQGGAGEVYAYIPTYAGFCEERSVACDRTYGTTLSRGNFGFARGGWTTITQLVSLNTPDIANGALYLWVNDTLAISHEDVLWRTNPNVTLSSVFFSTFFGGGDDSYNSRGGKSYFRRFEVFSSPLPSSLPGKRVKAIYGDPYPPSRLRAKAISASLVYFTCLTIVGSRMIVAMTTDRQLPAFFGYMSKHGVPYWAFVRAREMDLFSGRIDPATLPLPAMPPTA
ncbi:hypothetical protein JCM10450v2_006865 [Rhodotorula kratochvilovae]